MSESFKSLYRQLLAASDGCNRSFHDTPAPWAGAIESARDFAEAFDGELTIHGGGAATVAITRSDSEEIHSAGYSFNPGDRKGWGKHWAVEKTAVAKMLHREGAQIQREAAADVAGTVMLIEQALTSKPTCIDAALAAARFAGCFGGSVRLGVDAGCSHVVTIPGNPAAGDREPRVYHIQHNMTSAALLALDTEWSRVVCRPGIAPHVAEDGAELWQWRTIDGEVVAYCYLAHRDDGPSYYVPDALNRVPGIPFPETLTACIQWIETELETNGYTVIFTRPASGGAA